MNNSKLSNLVVVSEKTGEIKCYLTTEEIKYLDSKRNNGSLKKINDKSKRKDKNLFNQFIDEEFGSFYFFKYKNLLNKEYLFRFTYLTTYVNYKGYLVYGNGLGEASLVSKKDLIEMLEPVKKTAAKKTIKYLCDLQLLKIDESGKVFIDKKYCCRGKLSNKGMKNYTKIIDKNIQELYIKSSPKEHKTIDLFIRLLPYIHFKYNFICSNPEEENIELVKPLKQTEILEILDISKRTGSKLLSYKINKGTESVFCKISNCFIKNVYIINPRFTFKTNNLTDLEESLALFKVKKTK